MTSHSINVSAPSGTDPRVTNDVPLVDAAPNRSSTGSSTSSSDLDLNWREKNLLSLDGGGIRGYWSLLMLKRLMEVIGEEEQLRADAYNAQLPHSSPLRQTHIDSFWPQDCPPDLSHVTNANGAHEPLSNGQKFLPVHYFDTICGSSTGGLIAIMLGRFRMTVADCLYEYEKLGQRVFGKPRWISQRSMPIVPWPKYSARSLEKVFKDVAQRRCELSARGENNFNAPTFPTMEGTCNVFVTAIRKSTSPKGVKAHTKYIIRSYDNGMSSLTRTGTSATRPTLNYGSKEAMKIWHVARAATAAPLYFAALKLDNPHSPDNMKYYFSDGGFGAANNPCLLGIQELERLHGHDGHDNVGAVVSVGTSKAGSSPSGVNFFFDTVKGLTDEATNVNTIADILENQHRPNYWRFNDRKGLEVELDEWKPNGMFTASKNRGSTTLATVTHAFREWALDSANDRQIKECARALVDRRRARTANTSLWEQYATGATCFRCKHRSCRKSSYTFRHEFETHFVRKHQGKSDALEYREPEYMRWTYPPR